MSNSSYLQSLQQLFKTFTNFFDQILVYLNETKSNADQNIKQYLTLWMHHHGVVNLLRNLAHQHSIILPQPQCQFLNQIFEKVKQLNSKNLLTETKKLATVQQIGSSKNVTNFDDHTQNILDLNSKKIELNINQKDQKKIGYFQFSEIQLRDKSIKRGHYKSYTADQKLQAVNLYVQQSVSAREISKRLGIPIKNIKRWAADGITRKSGGRRKESNLDLQKQLLSMLRNQYSPQDAIQIDQIQTLALSMSSNTKFKPSYSWIKKFINRFNLRSHYKII